MKTLQDFSPSNGLQMRVSVQLQRALNATRRRIRVLSSEKIGAFVLIKLLRWPIVSIIWRKILECFHQKT